MHPVEVLAEPAAAVPVAEEAVSAVVAAVSVVAEVASAAEALAKILDKYRETGSAEGMVFPPKRRVEAAARVLRGKA